MPLLFPSIAGSREEKFAESSFSGDNGYVKLNNGLIIQFGTTQHSHGEFHETYNFPKSFPNKCFACVGSVDIGVCYNELNWSVYKVSNSQYGAYIDGGGYHKFQWIAFGY